MTTPPLGSISSLVTITITVGGVIVGVYKFIASNLKKTLVTKDDILDLKKALPSNEKSYVTKEECIKSHADITIALALNATHLEEGNKQFEAVKEELKSLSTDVAYIRGKIGHEN